MSEQLMDPREWTFDESNRLLCRDFSIAIPDGWEVHESKGGHDEPVALPAGVELSADVTACARYHAEAKGWSRGIEHEFPGWRIPELVRAMRLFDTVGISGERYAPTRRVGFTRTRDCYCMVLLADTFQGLFPVLGIRLGWDVYICPCDPSTRDFVRLSLRAGDVDSGDALFEAGLRMAETVELASPAVCEFFLSLREYATSSRRVGDVAFCRTVDKLFTTLAAARDLERMVADQRFVHDVELAREEGRIKRASQVPSLVAYDIEFFSDFADRTLHYMEECLEAYRHQKEIGATGEMLRKMTEALVRNMRLYEARLVGCDAKEQAEIDALGNVRRPDGYERLWDAIEAECPGCRARHDAEGRAPASFFFWTYHVDVDRPIATDFMIDCLATYATRPVKGRLAIPGYDWDGISEGRADRILEEDLGTYRKLENDAGRLEGLFPCSFLKKFPLVLSIEGTHHMGRAENIEGLRVGDPLVLVSDWQNPWFKPCCIEVFDSEGRTLGNISDSPKRATRDGGGSDYHLQPWQRERLALLLPYVTATVESVTPLSQRRSGAKYALLDVRLELDESLAANARTLYDGAEVCDPRTILAGLETLKKQKAKRVTMSRSDLDYADLKGQVDTSKMPPRARG